MESSFHKSPNTIHCPCHWVPFTRLTLQTFCEYTVLHFVSALTRWHVSLSAERPCYSFYISRKTELILDRLRYITKYRRTLSVSPRERYDFLVSICPVSLVSYRSPCSRGDEQWLQCRLPKRIPCFGDTFDAPKPWSAIRLSGQGLFRWRHFR